MARGLQPVPATLILPKLHRKRPGRLPVSNGGRVDTASRAAAGQAEETTWTQAIGQQVTSADPREASDQSFQECPGLVLESALGRTTRLGGAMHETWLQYTSFARLSPVHEVRARASCCHHVTLCSTRVVPHPGVQDMRAPELIHKITRARTPITFGFSGAVSAIRKRSSYSSVPPSRAPAVQHVSSWATTRRCSARSAASYWTWTLRGCSSRGCTKMKLWKSLKSPCGAVPTTCDARSPTRRSSQCRTPWLA